MNLPKVINALNYLDDDLISDAIEYRPKKKPIWFKWAGMAACLCLFALLAIGLWLSGIFTQKELPQEIRLSAFEISPANPNADSFGDDGLFHVDVILQGNRLYMQMLPEEYSVFGVGEVLRKADFGTHLGTVTALVLSEALPSSPCSEEPTLENCEVYLYAPVKCEAVIIVQGNGHCSLFRFADFIEEGYGFVDICQIFGAAVSDAIERIDYQARKPNGPVVEIYDTGMITDPEHLQAFFNITMRLQPYVRESAWSGNPEWLNIAREEFNKSPEDNRIFIEAKIILKNKLFIEFSYQPALGTGHVPGHYFLSEEDNAVMKEMFCT